MFRYLSLMVKNTLRNRRRSILTVGSIAVSLCLLGTLMAMYRALFLGDPSPAQALRLVCRNRVSLTQSMPISYRLKMQQIPGIKDIMVWQWFGGTYKDNRDPKNMFARFGAEPDRIFNIRPEFVIPDDQKQAFLHQQTGCIVSESLAKKLNFKLGDRIVLQGDIFPVSLELTLVGIYGDPENVDTLYFNRAYLRESLGAANPRADQVGAFQIQANRAEDVPRIARDVDALFENSPAQTKTESERAFQLSFAAFLGNLKLFLMAICGAVTFTILLVSANTISMSVRERVREVGIMKTLGFTPTAILGIVLGESVFISIVGGTIGCGFAALMCLGVRKTAGNFIWALTNLSVTPDVLVLSILIAALIGLTSSFVPAWNASRTSILDALRNAG